jgi:hypothetical protein
MTCLAYSLAYSPDGKTIAVGSKLWLRLWDAASGKLIRSFPGAADVGAIAFSPDGGLLASAEEDGGIAVWNANTGTRLRGFQLSPRPLRAIAFSPNGQNLAASGWDGNIYVCDAQLGTVVRKIREPRRRQLGLLLGGWRQHCLRQPRRRFLCNLASIHRERSAPDILFKYSLALNRGLAQGVHSFAVRQPDPIA